LMVCSNYTGSRRMPLWVFGKTQNPHALRRVNIKVLGLVYRANKKAWMIKTAMMEWLNAFYAFIGDGQVLLLMDNFPSHLSGVKRAPPPPNIRI